MEIVGTPFVPHVDQDARPLITNAVEYLKTVFSNNCHPQINNLQTYGVVKIMGYEYDFKPLLTKFLYKQYGDWAEVYAPNKTLLRESVYGRIDKIVAI